MEPNQNILAPAVRGVVAEVRTVLDAARSHVARQGKSALLQTDWNIVRIIGCSVREKRRGERVIRHAHHKTRHSHPGI